MRFKFTCTCGKRLAAYSWMVGKVTECPKCKKTMTIPTPERAAELLGTPGGQIASRYHLERPEHRRRTAAEWVLAAFVLVLSLSTGILLGYLYFFGYIHYQR